MSLTRNILTYIINSEMKKYLFFLVLVFSPAFLLLKAWDVPNMPTLTGLFTLDNVKISVIGFSGYYVMALLFVVRKQRDRVQRELQALTDIFTAGMKPILREEVARPLADFSRAFARLEERLDRCSVSS